jgi:hypothetical protein
MAFILRRRKATQRIVEFRKSFSNPISSLISSPYSVRFFVFTKAHANIVSITIWRYVSNKVGDATLGNVFNFKFWRRIREKKRKTNLTGQGNL